MAKRPGASNTLRIIAGRHGGRKLRFPDARGLRPTADRVRETLFNWLRNDIQGSRCLDLFAGSGALGFEAASRGASDVTMVESSAAVAASLRSNSMLLDLQDVVEVVHKKAASWVAQFDGDAYNVVFLDPPFADGLLDETLKLLQFGALLADRALIYIERDARQGLPDLPDNWQVLRYKKAGQVAYSLIQLAS
jgi:16S rRNA (guanine966-N2)-methyltransferase